MPARSRRPLAVSVLLFVICAATPATASDEGMFAADQVSELSYVGFLDQHLFTHNGDSRGPSSSSDLTAARDNIAALMQSYGLTVTLEPFTYGSGTYHNVVGTKTGTIYPTLEFVIGAHYDSVSNPGADDNASGTALVLEAARIISQYDSAYTIRFVAFSMEEVGLVGSEEYVTAHYNDSILGMISADMVAFDTGTNHARIYGQTASSSIKTELAAAVAEYGEGLTSGDYGPISASDHHSFESAGIPACLLIEGEVWNNPHYHTQQDSFDTPNYLDFPYAVKMTRSVVGWLVDVAEVAVPVDTIRFNYPDGLPQYVSPAGGDTLRVEVVGVGTEVPEPNSGVLHYNIGLGWQTAAMAEISPNMYEATFPAAVCGDEVHYYVSVESVSGEVYTYPRTAPGTSHDAVAAYGERVLMADELNAEPAGWIKEGLWAYGRVNGLGGDHGSPDPIHGHTGRTVFGYNLSGDYENSLPERHLTSAPIDCTGALRTRLRFWRWLGVEQPQYDHAYVRVSNDGANFTTVWQNVGEVADNAWQPMDLDISTVADDEPAVQLRWTMGTTDGSWQYCGWNIDDIEVVALDCTPPADGDHDVDGDVDLRDHAALQACFHGEGVIYTPGGFCPAFDFDEDGDVDLGDYAAFLTLATGPAS